MGQAMTWAATALDGIAYGMLLFVVAAGLTLIFGVADVLNLAHGVFYLAGTYLFAAWCDGSLTGLATVVAAGVLLGGLSGGFLDVALRPVTGGHLPQALATIGIAFLAADGFTTAFGAAPLPADPPAVLAGRAELFGHGYPVYRLVFIAVAAVIAVGLHLVLRHSIAGVRLRATVADAQMAAASGIRTGRVKAATMATGGGLAVSAGVLGAPLLGPAPGVDTTVLVLSLIIVVLGGAGSVPATLLAALAVGQVHTVGVIVAPVVAPFTLFGAVLLALTARRRHTGTSTAVART